MPNVRTVKAEGKGSVCLRIKDDKEAERVIRVSSVLFVPDLSCNLFSVRDITDKGNRMMFDDITCSVITRGDVVIASGHCKIYRYEYAMLTLYYTVVYLYIQYINLHVCRSI